MAREGVATPAATSKLELTTGTTSTSMWPPMRLTLLQRKVAAAHRVEVRHELTGTGPSNDPWGGERRTLVPSHFSSLASGAAIVAEPMLTCTDPGLGWLFDYSIVRLIWYPLTPVPRGETLG